MDRLPGPFGAVLVLIVLVGFGYLVGRTVQVADQRFSYLAVGTFIAVILGVVGLVLALDGIIEIAVPQKVVSSRADGRAIGLSRRAPLPFALQPGVEGKGGMSIQLPPDEGGPQANHSVRDGGLVRLFRGLVLLVASGAFLYTYRRLMPTAPAARATGRRRS